MIVLYHVCILIMSHLISWLGTPTHSRRVDQEVQDIRQRLQGSRKKGKWIKNLWQWLQGPQKCAISRSKDGLIFPKRYISCQMVRSRRPNHVLKRWLKCWWKKESRTRADPRWTERLNLTSPLTTCWPKTLNKLNEKNIQNVTFQKKLNLSDLHYDCYSVEICGEPLLCICLPCFNRLLRLHHSKSTLACQSWTIKVNRLFLVSPHRRSIISMIKC